MRSPAIQTVAAKRLLNTISEKTGTEISVGRIRYGINKNLVIRDLYVEDEKKDTLLFIPRLEAGISDLDINNKSIHLYWFKITEAYSQLVQINDSTFNFSFILNTLKNENKSKFDWIVDCDELSLSNAALNYKDHTRKHHKIEKLNFKAIDIHIDSTNQNFNISSFNSNYNDEKLIESLSLNVGIFNNQIILQNLNLNANNSTANVPSAFIQLANNKRNEKLKYEIKVSSSHIEPSKFASLLPQLKKIELPIELSGSLSGTNKNISSNELNFNFGNESSLLCNFNIQSFNKIENLSYSMDISSLFASKTDILNLYSLISNDTLEIPAVFDSINELSYTGVINGNYTNLYNKGALLSQLGQVKTDITLKNDTLNKQYWFEGNLIADPLYPNIVLKDSVLKEVSFNINTSGYFSQLSGANFNIDGYLKNLHFNNYIVDSIGLKGKVTNNLFKGRIASFDNNLRFDFDGDISIDTVPSYDFDLILYSANLHKLGVVKDDTTANLSFEITADFIGNNINNSTGEIQISDIFYFTDTSYFATDSIHITSEPAFNGRSVRFFSEYAEANVEGDFNFLTLYRSVKTVFNNYLPSMGFAPSKVEQSNEISFGVLATYPHPITKLIDPELKISAGTYISGSLDASKMHVDFTCETDQLSYKGKGLKNLDLKGFVKNNKLNINITTDEFSYSKKNSLKNFNISSIVYEDSIETNFNWNNWLDESYSGNINTLFTIQNTNTDKNLKLDIFPSNIIVLDTIWFLSQSFIEKDSSGLRFHNLKIDNGTSKWELAGIYSDNPSDSIVVNLQKVNMALLNILLKNDKLVFGGTISGKTQINDIKGERKINSDLFVNKLSLNNEVIGDTKVKTNWIKDEMLLQVEGQTLNNNIETFSFKGYLSPNKDIININTKFSNHRLNVLKPFLKPTLDNADGYISGEIKLHGRLRNPSWEGQVNAYQVNMRVAPTNVYYNFDGPVYFNDHHIIFRNLEAFDEDRNNLFINGNINHFKFRDFYYDLLLNSDKILAVDLKRNTNPYYFGKIYGSGNMKLIGGGTTVDIDIAAQTSGPSFIQIPIEGKGEIKENDFIEFTSLVESINEEEKNEEKETVPVISTVTNLRIDLDVTPDIEVQIIFDPRIGDMLRANGVAHLTIESLGPEFNMYGDYTITKGDFMFTLQNVINKRLEIQQGSTVSWNGHPLDADIDLDAVYRVRKASVYDLTLDEIDKDKRIEVNTHLLMTGKLVNQSINFAVDVPYATNVDAVDQLNSLPEEDLNKQVLSLLLVNRFTALSSFQTGIAENTTGNLTSTTASELLSNQLSNWMSQISNDFDLGFVYRPRDGYSEQEVELALSTNLFNDRIIFNSNVGYSKNKENRSNTDNPNPYTTDFQLEYKLNDKGNLRLRAFNIPNNDITYSEALYTQGVGVFYTEEFDTFGELMQKMFRKDVGNKPDEIEIEDDNGETSENNKSH